MIRLRWRIIGLCFLVLVSLLVSGCFGLWSGGLNNGGTSNVKIRGPSPTGRYIVVFKDKAIPAGAEADIEALGARIVAKFPPIGVLVAASADPAFPNQVAALPGVLDVGSDPFIPLPGDPDDRYVVLDPPVDPIPVSSALAPLGLEDDINRNDLYVLYQWDIKRVGGHKDTWAINQGAGVTVAVLDTGVYAAHPDIALNYAYGKSFVDITVQLPPGWILWDQGGTQDYEGHGTHVAGSIAATMLDGRIIGVAPQAKIANYKVMIAVLIPIEGMPGYYQATGVGLSSWIIAGLMQAADDGVQVANLSLGGSGLLTDPEDLAWFIAYARATQYAWEKGVLVVSAAGNDEADFSRGPWRNAPSMTPASLAVTATGPGDSLAFYSNWGAFNADFAGPGGDISNRPYSLCLSSYSPLNAWAPGAGWVWMAGTSMAAPKVSGVAALVFSVNPGITPTEVVRILERTAEDLGEPGFDFKYGWGLAHAYRALTQ